MKIRKLVLSAMLLAIGMLLPFLTMHLQSMGRMLLPMHIPVLLCGFICGPFYGALVGLILPLLNSTFFGMPPMMPVALAMSVELFFYGLSAGLLHKLFKNYTLGIYPALILSMLIGRIAWGITSYVLFALIGNVFTWQIFFAQAFIGGIPGIIVQLILIPALILSLKRTNMEVLLNEQ